MTNVRKAEREQAAARQAAFSLVSAKETKRCSYYRQVRKDRLYQLHCMHSSAPLIPVLWEGQLHPWLATPSLLAALSALLLERMLGRP
jgi:hypothetical protein